MRKWWLRGLGLVVGLGALAIFLTARPDAPTHHINRASFGKIAVGMARDQVEAILGAPPGNYAQGRAVPEASNLILPPGTAEVNEWVSEEAVILVAFDPDGRVLFTTAGNVFPVEPPSLVDRVRGWLRL